MSCRNFNVKISSAWSGNLVKEGGCVHLVQGGANPAWNESSSIVLSQWHELEQNYKHEFQVHMYLAKGASRGPRE